MNENTTTKKESNSVSMKTTPEIKKALKELADQQGRNVSQQLFYLFKKYVLPHLDQEFQSTPQVPINSPEPEPPAPEPEEDHYHYEAHPA